MHTFGAPKVDHIARRPHPGGGFTLIELVAVIVIMAIMAATIAPAMSSIGDTRAAAAARHLLRDLTFARQRAVATGTRHWVVFDVDVESWQILVEDPTQPGRANANALIDPATGHAFAMTLGTEPLPDVALTSVDFDDDPEIGFDWLGRPLNADETFLAATGEVILTGNHQITVEIGTGAIAHVEP